MNAYTKIRAALERALEVLPTYAKTYAQLAEALTALVELERASKEPVAEVVQGDGFRYLIWGELPTAGTNLYTTTPPAPVVAPQFIPAEVDDATATRVCFTEMGISPTQSWPATRGRAMIAAVRSELGPTLGLVPPDARADARIAELEAALRRVRRWCMGDGYSASVQVAMQEWIDGGMVGAMPKLTGLESAIEARAGNGGEG